MSPRRKEQEKARPESTLRELTAEEVRRDLTADLERLGYGTTESIPPLEGFVGQERAKESARTSIKMARPGFNLYVRYGLSGRHEFVDAVLGEYCSPPEGLRDLCIVHSFAEGTDYEVLRPEPGQAEQLKQDVAGLIAWLEGHLPDVEAGEECRSLEGRVGKEDEDDHASLTSELKALGVTYSGDAKYNSVYALSGSDAAAAKGNPVEDGKKHVRDYFRRKAEREKRTDSERTALCAQVLRPEVEARVAAMAAKYSAEGIPAWLSRLAEDALSHLREFRPADEDSSSSTKKEDEEKEREERSQRPELLLATKFRRYEVNVQVDHAGTPRDRPLVVTEERPSRGRMAGKRKNYSTSLTSKLRYDHMSIDLGNLVKAKGGTYVVDIEDMLIDQQSWTTFMNIIKKKEVQLAETSGFFGMEMDGPDIEGIDISDVRFVLVGEYAIDGYVQYSTYFDEKFVKEHFKVVADFEPHVKVSDLTTGEIAAYISKVRASEGLLHFDRGGVAAAAEHLLRMSGSKDDFSLMLGSRGLSDVLVEADFVAHEAGASLVGREHVQQALADRRRRVASWEDRYREYTLDKLATIDLEGERVGEAHALSVYTTGDIQFCMPTKATAVTSMGDKAIVDIMEEVNLAGEIYRFGMNELQSYLKHTFGQKEKIAFEARIVKEECYGGIDGNSSSALNTVVLLSQLSGVPIIQRRAMTGGISQKGHVVPIGAESTKVEGFYDACKYTGMLDRYDDCGVVLPEKNVRGLQLRPDVVEAIRQGKFHVWAVSRIEDAVEKMTGADAGATYNPLTGAVDLDGGKESVFYKASQRLRQYSGHGGKSLAGLLGIGK